jgi:hypothetical protein
MEQPGDRSSAFARTEVQRLGHRCREIRPEGCFMPPQWRRELAASRLPNGPSPIRTKPNKAIPVNLSIYSDIQEKLEKQSQSTYHLYFEIVNVEKWPIFAPNVPEADTSLNWGGRAPVTLSASRLVNGETKPNKAAPPNRPATSCLERNLKKQSQGDYLPCFQSFGVEKRPVFSRNVRICCLH